MHPKNIKETFQEIKETDHSGHQAAMFMKTAANKLQLVFWETTAGCNLECVHCRRLDVSSQLMKDDLTTQQAFRMIDSIAETGRPILVLSGGEPLFRPDIFEIAEYTTKEKGLICALATNGTLVDARIAEKVKASGIQRVSISLDGADAETHDSFRKLKGSFNRAIEGLNHLKKAGVEVQINSTIARHNAHQAKELYQLALDLGAVALHIFMLVPVGCGVEIADEEMLDPKKYEELLNWFYDVSKENKIQTKATCAPHYFRIMRQRAKEEGIKITPKTHGMAAMTKGCLAGSSICFVSHKGQVFPCGYLPVEAGNVLKESFKSIWEKSSVFARLRDTDQLGGKCGICEFKKVCEGCRARAYYETGDYMEEEPYCIYEPARMADKESQEI